jgi:hypothetical protein
MMAMARRYSSFVLRCWLLDGGEQRITVEHIQSRERFQGATTAEALAWMDARCAGPSADAARGDARAPSSSPDKPEDLLPPR